MWLFSTAWAHEPGLSFARMDHNTLTLTFSQTELASRMPVSDLQAARLILEDATLDQVRVDRGGPCTLGQARVQAVERDGIELSAPLSCPSDGTGTYTASFWQGLDPGHRHIVEA